MEFIQFTNYKAPSGKYGKHIDCITDHVVRKLSFVLQLSNPENYEGGELQIEDALGNIVSVTKNKGAIIFFDSRTRHRVSKVTKGSRQSLVGWVVGPMWK